VQIPKSAIFTLPFVLIKIFYGFISRWIILWSLWR